MKLVTYRGPYGALEIDGKRLERGGEPVELTEDQVKRLKGQANCDIAVSQSEGEKED